MLTRRAEKRSTFCRKQAVMDWTILDTNESLHPCQSAPGNYAITNAGGIAATFFISSSFHN